MKGWGRLVKYNDQWQGKTSEKEMYENAEKKENAPKKQKMPKVQKFVQQGKIKKVKKNAKAK